MLRFCHGSVLTVRWSELTSWRSVGRLIIASLMAPPCVASPTCGGSTWRTRPAWFWTWNRHLLPISPGEDQTHKAPPPDTFTSCFSLRPLDVCWEGEGPKLSVTVFPRRPNLQGGAKTRLTWTLWVLDVRRFLNCSLSDEDRYLNKLRRFDHHQQQHPSEQHLLLLHLETSETFPLEILNLWQLNRKSWRIPKYHSTLYD